METNNPYQGPAGDPQPLAAREVQFGKGQRVPVGHGWQWLREAWGIVGQNKAQWPLAFLVISILLAVASLVSLFIPFIGGLLVTVVVPVFMVGLFHMAHDRAEGGPFEFGDLFVGFSNKTGPLLMTGLSQVVLRVAYMVIMFLLLLILFGGDIARLFMNGMGPSGGDPRIFAGMGGAIATKGILFGLLMLVVLIPYMAAVFFQIPLVYFGDRKAFPALVESFKSTFSNWLPLLWFGVLMFLIMVLLSVAFLVVGVIINLIFGSGALGFTIFCLLGLVGVAVMLLLMSVSVVSIYMAFRDIFGVERSRQEAGFQQEQRV